MSEIIAVSWTDFQKSGCINCGCEYCYSTGIQGGGTSPVKCGECEAFFVILADGLKQSTMGFRIDGGISMSLKKKSLEEENKEERDDSYPRLQEHPRKSIPKHPYVRPDVCPEGGGEFWAPRGVGYDLSGFVKCKAAGERIVKMVEAVIGRIPKTWLDYRPSEPNWIQVKIQSEDGFDLEVLDKICGIDGIITEDRLKRALRGADSSDH